MMHRPTVLDVFAGCGGLARGFVDEGYELLLAVERDPDAAATYAANFGSERVICADVRSVADDRIPEADVVIGGPPSLGFSRPAGPDVEDPGDDLWKHYLRILVRAQPQAFVIEQSSRFAQTPECQVLLAESDTGSLKDYEVSVIPVRASDYGAAQHRPRTVVIGVRAGLAQPLEPTHCSTPSATEKAWVTVRDRIAGLPAANDTWPDRRSVVLGQERRGPFSGLEIHSARRPSELWARRYDHVPPGGDRSDLPEDLLPEAWRHSGAGAFGLLGRLCWDRPAPTVGAEFFKPVRGTYLHPQWDASDPDNRTNRAITHLEAARLQGFPDDFAWVGSKVSIARQIGLASPLELARAIARSVRRAVTEDDRGSPEPPRARRREDRSRRKPLMTAPPDRGRDPELDVVTDFFTSPTLSETMGRSIREAIDEAIDTPRTGRWHLDQCNDQEKNYIGVVIERIVRQAYSLPPGQISQDFHVAGVDFDCKWSRNFGHWQIPQEAVGHICLLLYADDLDENMAVGLIRVREDLLVGGNRDTKREIQSPGGRSRIRWLHPEGPGLPSNFLMDLPEADRNAILAPKGGDERARELFQRCDGMIIKRHVIRSIGSQLDDSRRFRGETRAALEANGFIVLNGHWKAQKDKAAELGGPVPGRGEWVCLRKDGTSGRRREAEAPQRRAEAAASRTRLKRLIGAEREIRNIERRAAKTKQSRSTID